MVDTVKSNEWFRMAMIDYTSAKILFEHDGDYGVICFHMQQCIEKYLKGYLIYKTGMLHGGHGLRKLCSTASTFNEEFNKFKKDLAFVGDFYIEVRYPQEDPLIATKEDTEDCFKIADEIMSFINGLVE